MSDLAEDFNTLLLELIPEQIENTMFADGIERPHDVNKYKREKIKAYFNDLTLVPKRMAVVEPETISELRAEIMQGKFGVIKTDQLMISGNINIIKQMLEEK